MSKTYNRGKLLRLCLAGKLELMGSYSFDDMMGESRSRSTMPVAIKPADYRDRKEGICYVTEWDFKSSSGRAWSNENGTVTLYVHSNSHYDFRIKE